MLEKYFQNTSKPLSRDKKNDSKKEYTVCKWNVSHLSSSREDT